MHGEGRDRKVRAIPFYPTHGRAPPGPPPPPVFFERAFSKVKTPKRASRDGAAVRGAAPRGPTCTALRDLPTDTPPVVQERGSRGCEIIYLGELGVTAEKRLRADFTSAHSHRTLAFMWLTFLTISVCGRTIFR